MSKQLKSEDGNVHMQKKPIYKRVWVWTLSAITVIILGVASGIALGGGSNTSSSSEADTMTHKVAKNSSSETEASEQSDEKDQSSEAETSSHKDDEEHPDEKVTQSSSSSAATSSHAVMQKSPAKSAANHTVTQNSPAKATVPSHKVTQNSPAKATVPSHKVAQNNQAPAAVPSHEVPAPAPAAPNHPVAEKPAQPKVPAQSLAALDKAKSYADMHMSEKGIYEQLISDYGEQFSPADAQYAMAHLTGINWNENARKMAESYQKDQSMSITAIKDQLTSSYGEGFTNEQAQYAIDHLSK